MGFKSFFILGFRFFIHMLAKVAFWRRHPGADRFVANFRADRLAPLTPEERLQLASFMRCTDCGLCEAACPLSSQTPALALSSLAAANWRDLTNHHLIAESAAELERCEECELCELSCPEQIPLRQLAGLVARYGQQTA
jgi:succinate dehydrogenase/fumarate reductase-like Fe-S protein